MKYAQIFFFPGLTECGKAQDIWEIDIDILVKASIEIHLLHFNSQHQIIVFLFL